MPQGQPFSSPFDVLNIRARPTEHEAIIRRQGQYSRILSSTKCPCIKNGRPDIHCSICDGKGYTLNYQKSAMVIDENSPHYGDLELFPLGTPIIRSIAAKKCLPTYQGGPVDFTIDSWTNLKVVISGGKLRRYEKILHTYEYSLENSITNENCTHDGDYTINTIATKLAIQKSANAFNISSDITEVTRIYNVTQDKTYTLSKFYKQSIVIATHVSGAPLLTDVLQVDYKYIEPAQIATGRMDLKNAIRVWGEDIKEGDVQAIVPGYYYINKGDIITFLFPRVKTSEVIKRGISQKDELPQFDVVEILDDIIDEDGNTYDSDNYTLEEYNDLVWDASEGPAAGKKYTVNFVYRPSYRIYKQNIDLMANSNQRFPNLVLMRFINKWSRKEMFELD